MSEKRLLGLTFDIETGPLRRAELEQIYVEPTLESYIESKGNVNWKPDTFVKKFNEEYRPQHWDKFVERAPLNPLHGRVMMVGYGFRVDDEQEPHKVLSSVHISDSFSEVELIEQFWRTLSDAKDRGIGIAGYNTLKFDMPFMIRRSWVHHIPIPPWVGIQGPRYFNFDQSFVDIANIWSVGTTEYISLDVLCKGLGIKGKVNDGKNFFKLFMTDIEAAKAYNQDEIKKNLLLCDRFGIF